MNSVTLALFKSEIAALTATKKDLDNANEVLTNAMRANDVLLNKCSEKIARLENEIANANRETVMAEFNAWPQFVCMGTYDRRSRRLTESEKCAIARFCKAGINRMAIALKFSLLSLQTVSRYENYTGYHNL
jgi:3-methyladenine DNA glycosylase AlkC